jgi:ribonuclease P protein component
MERLKRRAEFLAAARGVKVPAAAFVLQAHERGDAGEPRFGFTVSKKVGNAVERNRVKRRLREIVRQSTALPVLGGHDYVLIGRRTALAMPFGRMAADFAGAIKRAGKRHARPAAESTT